jgi:hypothetical protein
MILARDDATQFFRLMWGLQFYVKQREKMPPDAKSKEDYGHLPAKDKLPVRTALWNNRQVIDAYLQENPDHLPPEELDIVQGWKKAVVGDFYIHRYLKQHTIFLGESHVYGVLGLYDPLPYMYRDRPLPIMVKTVLLPFKGKIVYDGMCETYAIHFGAGIRGTFQREYMSAKQKGQIITSLDGESVAPKRVSHAPKLSDESQAAAAEIATASKHLRGRDALTRNVFQLLQASASMAQAVALDPNDFDKLWRLLAPIDKALRRTHRALERAEMYQDDNERQQEE